MNEGVLNIGVLDTLKVESFGEPGQRTFRVSGTTASGEVSIWLEKEQVVALGAAVEQLLERVGESTGSTPAPHIVPATISGEVSARAGSLSLAFDQSQDAFVLEATDLFDATLDVGTLVLLATRSQVAELEDQVDDIIAGGRPRCPMCGTALTEQAHFCPPSNGHARVRPAD
jgi:uncharacterized repeat protein (TIGR03847 family)